MKFKVQIDSQTYEVVLGDLNARPIRATIEGETFEVWPESEEQPPDSVRTVPAPPAATIPPPAPINSHRTQAAVPSSADAVRAPIPGVIISVAAQPGMAVSRGQELCMLEAMKMNNAIRSPRDGKIASVPATVGQAVKHGDVLVTFEA
ncbi:MAG: biotin/lipoyl-containing protein [Chloroflexota bacterium]